MRKKINRTFLIVTTALCLASALCDASSPTRYFRLTDAAIENVLREVRTEGGSDVQSALKAYFEKQGVVFSEHSYLAYDGDQIILTETEENADLIESICRELGIDETPRDEWCYFSHIEIKPSIDSDSLSSVLIHWKKEMEGNLIPVVTLNSPEYEKMNVLSRTYLEVHQAQFVDPFAKDAPICWVVSLEVDPNYLNRIFVGSLRPHAQMKSLLELKNSHNQSGDGQ